jgi:hypothetical protein
LKKSKLALLALIGAAVSCAPVPKQKTIPRNVQIKEFIGVKCPDNPPTDYWLCIRKKSKGIEQETSLNQGNLTIKLWTSKDARKIMKEQNFDKKVKPFSMPDFYKFVFDTFKENVSYYHSFAPHPVDEFHVILSDFGERRKSVAANASLGTSLIEIDVRRWHKMWSGYGRWRGNLASIHEYAHVQNYALDIKEVRRFREFTAIVIECAGLIHHYGLEAYVRMYEKKTVRGRAKLERIMDDAKWNMAALRTTAYRFVVNLTNGLYTHEDEKTLDKLKEFSSNLISSKKTGEAGFNEAAKSSGIMFAKKPLDFNTLQKHTYEEFLKRHKP